ncbi:MAG TPA: hypothetical protein VHE35_08280 [Kofleriaceae bacterium]|nr:hypothetical protein [Kofleriaceae bacterium]
MRFFLGLVVGLLLGAGGTYAALEHPWRGRAKAAAPAVVEVTPPPLDAGVAPHRKHRTTRTTTPAGTIEREVDDDVVLTDADRALEWRGDAVAQPARTIDLAGGSDGRPLDDGEIQSAVSSGSGAMIDCIKDAVGGAPLSGAVTLELLVGGDGAVQKLRVRAPHYLHEHGLLACARRAARSLPFASTGAPTVVTVPYDLD